MQDKGASADIEAVASYPGDLANIINGGSYTAQIFSADKTAFYWKRMPSRTFIATEEKPMSGFKSSRDCLTSHWANAAGDFQLNLILIYHSKNPRALRIMLYYSACVL